MNNDETDIETKNKTMSLAFEHYTARRKILLKKFKHAQTATREGVQDIITLSENSKKNTPDVTKEITEYDQLWEKAIKLFQNAYISDDALEKLENILLNIPEIIKKYYDALITNDLVLQGMVKDLASEKYKEALALINRVQSKPCTLSGLDPTEFDFAPDSIEGGGSIAEFFPPKKNTLK